jgi:LacI family transcriptional regulator
MSRKASITIYDIAEALALSPSTVSRALGGNTLIHKDTRQKIVEKARDLGYRQNVFATRLRTQRTNVIGALMPHLNDGLVSNIISGAEVTSRVAGYSLVIRQSMNRPDFFVAGLEDFSRSRVDGLMIINSGKAAAGVPENLTPNIYAPAVVIEDFWRSTPLTRRKTELITKNCYELTDRLIRRGCKRILYMASTRNKAHAGEFNGYRQALRDHKFTDTAVPDAVSFDGVESVANVCRKIMSMKKRPDGILFSTDIIAALSIPEQGSCISLPANDDLLCHAADQLPLPESDRSFLELGKLATTMLIGLVDNLHGE